MREDISILDLKLAVRAKYTSPGCYPLFCVTSDGAALCIDCTRAEFLQVARSIKSRANDGWRVVAYEVNWESEIYCDHCSLQIESAYPPISSDSED